MKHELQRRELVFDLVAERYSQNYSKDQGAGCLTPNESFVNKHPLLCLLLWLVYGLCGFLLNYSIIKLLNVAAGNTEIYKVETLTSRSL